MPGRRALLLGLLAAGCDRRPSSGARPAAGAAEAPPAGVSVRDWAFPDGPARGGSERAVALVPEGEGPWPVLVALHGRGEARRGAEAGAYGWLRDYRLGRAIEALRRGKLAPHDLLDLASPERLAALNAALAQTPYRGLVVVCPHVPDLTGLRGDDAAIERYGRWLIEALLPRARAEAHGDVAGIDGVSMGGRVALLVGTSHPDQFASVGTLQAAIQAAEIADLTRRARAYVSGRPGARLRLLTSDGDYFKPAIEALHDALARDSLPHDHLTVAGPHNYQFNQGPGGVEMLLWHDRALRGQPAP